MQKKWEIYAKSNKPSLNISSLEMYNRYKIYLKMQKIYQELHSYYLYNINML